MRAHVFIVNEETLPIHLQYNFVGTSSKERNSNISLLADMKRVKTGDLVFFYIEGRGTKKGRFFGTYQIKDEEVIHCQDSEALKPNLPVKLIYRRRIVPNEVFPQGILEWEALDKLPRFACELFWTLIYRKMKANRGNTMLFPWETNRLLDLIRDVNNNHSIAYQYYNFDKSKYEICRGKESKPIEECNVAQVMKDEIYKSESHLQAYLLENIGVETNSFLPEIFGKKIIWLGNEVFAGSGMQKIDIMTIEEVGTEKFLYRLIELKHPKSSSNFTNAPNQLEYYVNWAREDIGGHIIGARKFNIKPILINLRNSKYSLPSSIVQDFKKLEHISEKPEIWELDTNLHSNKVY